MISVKVGDILEDRYGSLFEVMRKGDGEYLLWQLSSAEKFTLWDEEMEAMLSNDVFTIYLTKEQIRS